MSGRLDHSPAEILRALFIQKGYGTDPNLIPQQAWPVFHSGEPDKPGSCITLLDYPDGGQGFGREGPQGYRTIHHSLQIRVRAEAHTAGWKKANAIAVAMDSGFFKARVTVGSARYEVETFTRTSPDVMVLGTEPESKRRSFVVNGRLVVRMV